MLQTLSDMVHDVKAYFEPFLFNHILPVISRMMLLGMQITLLWAFYQTVKHVIAGA